jgi:hypothetical protein
MEPDLKFINSFIKPWVDHGGYLYGLLSSICNATVERCYLHVECAFPLSPNAVEILKRTIIARDKIK